MPQRTFIAACILFYMCGGTTDDCSVSEMTDWLYTIHGKESAGGWSWYMLWRLWCGWHA